MTDQEFDFLTMLEEKGPLATYGKKKETDIALAFDLCEKGWAKYSKITPYGRLRTKEHHFFTNLAIDISGRSALEAERTKRKEKSVSGVAKKGFTISAKGLRFIISIIVTVVVTYYLTIYLTKKGEEPGSPPAQSQETHDKETK